MEIKIEMAIRRVANGRRVVARQRERVEMLSREGLDTTESKRTLDLFAHTLDIFEGNLERLLKTDGKRHPF